MVFSKCRKEDEDILFIDASREFEKGKNQNKLTDEHLAKIFDTYAHRKEIEKYSHKATLEEIKENDFNLNIPRYVDTFEEEDPIDIDAVAQEIQSFAKQEEEILQKIGGFCDELKISKPL
jgi:type I restriction enzyme M protein